MWCCTVADLQLVDVFTNLKSILRFDFVNSGIIEKEEKGTFKI